jgi:hypothetical protein
MAHAAREARKDHTGIPCSEPATWGIVQLLIKGRTPDSSPKRDAPGVFSLRESLALSV